ncbi:hypothetical protein NPIL_649471 [Nephila pilipes]|uniref:Uncharacterized protein n=1 Tax=Nephila pilipes TaxID=299642 RepID=A0A8X6Q6C1_NEPPI|nr:hypothetical protein NPIL_649471 [Nephila pilipes]
MTFLTSPAISDITAGRTSGKKPPIRFTRVFLCFQAGFSTSYFFKYTACICEEQHLLGSPYQPDCTDYENLWKKNNKSGPRSEEVFFETFTVLYLNDVRCTSLILIPKFFRCAKKDACGTLIRHARFIGKDCRW